MSPAAPAVPVETVRWVDGSWCCPRCAFGGRHATVAGIRTHFRRAHPDALPCRLSFPVPPALRRPSSPQEP